MATVLKRAVLRSLEQSDYVLLKKAEYDSIVAAAAAKPLAEMQQAPPAAVAASIPIEIKFEGDDGTLEYAKAGGIYVDGNQAPVFEDRLVSPMVANPRGTTVILTFGQSNAANSCEERYTPRGTVHVFHAFDMRFYRAIDPLAGSSVPALLAPCCSCPSPSAQPTSRTGFLARNIIAAWCSRCIGSSGPASRSTCCAGIRAR